jgi:hypothetical protein
MKRVVGVVEPFSFAIEGAKRDADIGMGVRDVPLDLLFGGGEVEGLCEGRSRQKCDEGEKEQKFPQGWRASRSAIAHE